MSAFGVLLLFLVYNSACFAAGVWVGKPRDARLLIKRRFREELDRQLARLPGRAARRPRYPVWRLGRAGTHFADMDGTLVSIKPSSLEHGRFAVFVNQTHVGWADTVPEAMVRAEREAAVQRARASVALAVAAPEWSGDHAENTRRIESGE